MRVGESIRRQPKPEQARVQILRDKMRGRACSEAIDSVRLVKGLCDLFNHSRIDRLLPLGDRSDCAADQVSDDRLDPVTWSDAAVEMRRSQSERGGKFQLHVANALAPDAAGEAHNGGRADADLFGE